jgi:hypothetical protein
MAGAKEAEAEEAGPKREYGGNRCQHEHPESLEGMPGLSGSNTCRMAADCIGFVQHPLQVPS